MSTYLRVRILIRTARRAHLNTAPPALIPCYLLARPPLAQMDSIIHQFVNIPDDPIPACERSLSLPPMDDDVDSLRAMYVCASYTGSNGN